MGEYGFMFLKCHYVDSYRSSLTTKYLVLDHKRRSVNYFVVTMHVNTLILSYNKFSGDLADHAAVGNAAFYKMLDKSIYNVYGWHMQYVDDN